MEKELPKYEEVVFPLGKHQKEYLALRIMGLDSSKSCRVIGRNLNIVKFWNRNTVFKEALSTVLDNQDAYLPMARQSFINRLSAKALLVLNHLLDKGLSWDKLDRTDKGYVMKAAELGIGLDKLSSGDKGSYEEIIFRARKSLDNIPQENPYKAPKSYIEGEIVEENSQLVEATQE